jgi:hypothetical protein
MNLSVYEDIGKMEINDVCAPYQDVSCISHGNPRTEDADDLLNEIVNAWNKGDTGVFPDMLDRF